MKPVYKILDIARLGLHNLRVHKVRSFLTALGITIGVMSVISTLAISEGGSQEAQRMIRELGSDNIIISSQTPVTDDAKASGTVTWVKSYGLTRQDIKQLLDNIPNIRTSAIVHRQHKQARYGSRSLGVVIMSTEPDYAQVAKIELVQGRFILPSDETKSNAVCIITESLSRKLLQYHDPMHKILLLGGEPFTIIGIIGQVPATMTKQPDGDSDDCVIIPISADRDRFGQLTINRSSGSSSSEQVYASQLVLQMKDEISLIEGAAVARNLLARSHPRGDYAVTIPQELLEQKRQQKRLWNVVLLAISLIALLVGGIGIMNIMLAGVTERTREIGIRRALGATRVDIIMQFLVEAVTLSVVGGLFGIGIGLLVPFVFEKCFDIPAVISTVTILLPLLVAVVVGLLSGLYPAVRAASLDPIVALRHE